MRGRRIQDYRMRKIPTMQIIEESVDRIAKTAITAMMLAVLITYVSGRINANAYFFSNASSEKVTLIIENIVETMAPAMEFINNDAAEGKSTEAEGNGDSEENAGNGEENTGGSGENTGGGEENTGSSGEDTGSGEENTGSSQEDTGGGEENTGGSQEDTGSGEENTGSSENVGIGSNSTNNENAGDGHDENRAAGS